MPSRNGLAAAATIALLWSGDAQAQVAPAVQVAPAENSAPDESPVLALPTVEVIGTSPLPGIGIDPDRLPNATYSFSAGELLREGPRELPRAIRDRLGSV